jgi:hypothetical protein
LVVCKGHSDIWKKLLLQEQTLFFLCRYLLLNRYIYEIK